LKKEDSAPRAEIKSAKVQQPQQKVPVQQQPRKDSFDNNFMEEAFKDQFFEGT
jgi:hypothetical protein